MKITNLKILNFRSYDNLNLSFNSNVNIIYGNNGEGKTNLVEAIYLLSLTKSFRINNDKLLIKKEEKIAKVSGEMLINNNLSTFNVSISNEGKKVEIDNNKIDRISDYISRITIVVFYPRDTEIIMSAPEARRKLINIEISQIYKEYMLLLANYNKILKQRNAYLKQLFVYGNASKDYLDILTKKLIEYGKNIYKYRDEYINNINKYIGSIYKDIFTEGNLEIKYISDYNKEEKDILELYRKNYNKEMSFGKTLYGPHRDDFEFLLDNNKLKEWGSQGQMKNAIISFKLAEISLIKEIKKEYPILILDDLFSELDNQKVKNIFKLLSNDIQTFITTTDIKNIPKNIKKTATVYKIINKSIKEVTYE